MDPAAIGRQAATDRLCPASCSPRLGIAHGLAIWTGMGGREGLTNGWPLWRDDHPLYYHSALVTRAFLQQTGTTAGYDPCSWPAMPRAWSFPPRQRFPNWSSGPSGVIVRSWLTSFTSWARRVALPWFVALAAAAWGLRMRARRSGGTVLFAVRLDRFSNQLCRFRHAALSAGDPPGPAGYGCVRPVPVHGGFLWWLLAALAMSLAVLVHLTAAMIVAPAAAAAYLAACVGSGAGNADSRTRATGRPEATAGAQHGTAASLPRGISVSG